MKRELYYQFVVYYYVCPMKDKVPVSRLTFECVLNHYNNVVLCKSIIVVLNAKVGKDVARMICHFAGVFDPFCQTHLRKQITHDGVLVIPCKVCQ